MVIQARSSSGMTPYHMPLARWRGEESTQCMLRIGIRQNTRAIQAFDALASGTDLLDAPDSPHEQVPVQVRARASPQVQQSGDAVAVGVDRFQPP